MIKVLIVEDERLAASKLEELLYSIDKEIEIVAIIDTVRESIEWIGQNSVDLIFLDIHLSDGISFDIFKKIEIKTPIIFTTAYDEYALKAFKVNSVDYLLKPFSKADVQLALGKFKSLFQNGKASPDIENLIRILNPNKQYQKRFLVNAGTALKSITIDEIAYFYNIEKNTFICSNNNQHYASSQSLDKLELLIDTEQFFRINRNFLIGFKSIKKMYSLSKSRIKLELQPTPDQEVLVSFNKSGEFRIWLGKVPEQ